MDALAKAQQALKHNQHFNGDKFESEALFLVPGDGNVVYELPHDEGRPTLGDLIALVRACEKMHMERII